MDALQVLRSKFDTTEAFSLWSALSQLKEENTLLKAEINTLKAKNRELQSLSSHKYTLNAGRKRFMSDLPRNTL